MFFTGHINRTRYDLSTYISSAPNAYGHKTRKWGPHQDRQTKRSAIVSHSVVVIPWDDDVDVPANCCFRCWSQNHLSKECQAILLNIMSSEDESVPLAGPNPEAEESDAEDAESEPEVPELGDLPLPEKPEWLPETAEWWPNFKVYWMAVNSDRSMSDTNIKRGDPATDRNTYKILWSTFLKLWAPCSSTDAPNVPINYGCWRFEQVIEPGLIRCDEGLIDILQTAFQMTKASDELDKCRNVSMYTEFIRNNLVVINKDMLFLYQALANYKKEYRLKPNQAGYKQGYDNFCKEMEPIIPAPTERRKANYVIARVDVLLSKAEWRQFVFFSVFLIRPKKNLRTKVSKEGGRRVDRESRWHRNSQRSRRVAKKTTSSKQSADNWTISRCHRSSFCQCLFKKKKKFASFKYSNLNCKKT